MAILDRVQKVAVVGAGISGVTTAAHCLQLGLDVTLFERASVAGGVWHYDSRTAPDPPFPNEKPSNGDYERPAGNAYITPPPEEHNLDAVQISHAPPSPCYAGLKNNVSTPLMRTSLLAWPDKTEDFVSQKILEEYIQSIAIQYGVDRVTKYNTRVDDIEKVGNVWKVKTISLSKVEGRSQLLEAVCTFDAIVVASGHYNMPRVPDIPGLSTWKQLWPGSVRHSKSYRTPEVFNGKTILLVGAGTSSCDIARESSKYAKHIYQSSRGGLYDLPASFLPEGNATRVGAIQSFDPPHVPLTQATSQRPIPASVTLADGARLEDLDCVIMCTGYITSYPFLSSLHSNTVTATQAGESLLVAREGNMVHNLWKDIFYIEDPTLAFVGAPYHIATFSLFDIQAQVVARVLAGKAEVPAKDIMRHEYGQRVEAKGLGRDFHSLRRQGDEQAYVTELVQWMNRDAARYGARPMLGHTEEWLAANLAREEKLRWLRERKLEESTIH